MKSLLPTGSSASPTMAQLNNPNIHAPRTTVRIVFADPMTWHRCAAIAKETNVEITRGSTWQQKGGSRVELTITGDAAARKLALERIEATVWEFFERKAKRRAELAAPSTEAMAKDKSEEVLREKPDLEKPVSKAFKNPYAALLDEDTEDESEEVVEEKEPRVSTPGCLDWTNEIAEGVTAKSCTPEQLTVAM